MDQGKTSLRTQRPVALEHEVELIRHNLTGIMGELDRRRHNAVSRRLLKRALGFGAAVATFALVATAVMVSGIGRHRNGVRSPLPRVLSSALVKAAVATSAVFLRSLWERPRLDA